MVLAQHLPPKIHMTQAMGAGNDVGNGAFSDRMKRYERLVLKEEFLQSQGNIAQMARNLALDRSNSVQKIAAPRHRQTAPRAPSKSQRERRLAQMPWGNAHPARRAQVGGHGVGLAGR